MNTTKLSKAMAYHLRHATQIDLLPGGWARIDELLGVLKGGTHRQVRAAVGSPDNPRFELSADGALVRARYGHSRPVELAYLPATPPTVLYHGTPRTLRDRELHEGITRQRRQAVHLSDSVARAREVGRRRGAPVVLEVAAAWMAADGHLFFHAAA